MVAISCGKSQVLPPSGKEDAVVWTQELRTTEVPWSFCTSLGGASELSPREAYAGVGTTRDSEPWLEAGAGLGAHSLPLVPSSRAVHWKLQTRGFSPRYSPATLGQSARGRITLDGCTASAHCGQGPGWRDRGWVFTRPGLTSVLLRGGSLLTGTKAQEGLTPVLALGHSGTQNPCVVNW